MLRKSHTDKGSAGQPKEYAPAVQTSPAPSQKTVIGEHISIEGDIKGREDLVIQGSVKGSVHLPECHLTIGPKGQVEAEIQAANVTISGTLAGNILAQGKVEITKEANFTGEIKAKRISVEDGAYLKATIEMEKEGASIKPAPTPINPAAKETLELNTGDKAGS
jgi:cytoskeletal protein CcmA (bactofilin family)